MLPHILKTYSHETTVQYIYIKQKEKETSEQEGEEEGARLGKPPRIPVCGFKSFLPCVLPTLRTLLPSPQQKKKKTYLL